MIAQAYKIEYGHFGVCYVGASSFKEAEEKFRSHYSSEDYEIRSIEKMINKQEVII